MWQTKIEIVLMLQLVLTMDSILARTCLSQSPIIGARHCWARILYSAQLGSDLLESSLTSVFVYINICIGLEHRRLGPLVPRLWSIQALLSSLEPPHPFLWIRVKPILTLYTPSKLVRQIMASIPLCQTANMWKIWTLQIRHYFISHKP